LLAKMPKASTHRSIIGENAGTDHGRMDHFSWMQRPAATANAVAGALRGGQESRPRAGPNPS
jgi:hypothetical protein